jgi:hypothetical protein
LTGTYSTTSAQRQRLAFIQLASITLWLRDHISTRANWTAKQSLRIDAAPDPQS